MKDKIYNKIYDKFLCHLGTNDQSYLPRRKFSAMIRFRNYKEHSHENDGLKIITFLFKI